MQIVALIWVINLFFFALILFFVWSKIAIISRKIASVHPTISSIDDLLLEPPAQPAATQSPAEKT